MMMIPLSLATWAKRIWSVSNECTYACATCEAHFDTVILAGDEDEDIRNQPRDNNANQGRGNRGNANQGRGNREPPRQQGRQGPQDRGLAALLAGLRLGVDPDIQDNNDDMILLHHYSWYEAIALEEERMGANVRLKRLTVDILLPGPTTLDQI